MPESLFTGQMHDAAQRLLGTVPDWKRIYRVEEIFERTRELARQHPDRVAVEEIGRSRQNRPVEAVTVGSGEMTVLLLGFPHPDEGVGSLMADHLLAIAAAHPEVTRAFNARLLVVKCWDVDGARLNEGWFPGETPLEEQARNHFRPPPPMQMEWTFPVEYKAHRWIAVPPETEAVRRLIDREKPHLMFGLHNAAVHDPYFYLSREAPEIYPLLAAAVADEGLKLSERSPDVPFEVALAPGIFRMYGVKDYYDYLEKYAPHRLPQLKRGGCSDDYLAWTVPRSASFNVEVPRAIDTRVRDRTPTDRLLRDVALERLRAQRREMWLLDNEVSPLLERHGQEASLLRQSVALHLEEFRARDPESATEIGGDPQYDKPATVAEVFEAQAVGPIEDLLVLGEGWRVAKEIAEAGDREAEKSEEFLGARVAALAASITERTRFHPVPLRNSASIQLRALTIMMAWRARLASF